MENSEIVKILSSIRDGQAEALALARQSLELQKNAVENQAKSIAEQMRIGRLYRRVVLGGAVPIILVVGFLIWVLLAILP